MIKKIIFLTVLMVSQLWAATEEFVAGKDYEILQGYNNPLYSGSPAKVIEFFSFGCPACYKIESQVEKWVTKEGNKINFSRVPVVFHPEWIFYAKAYHIINALNLGPKTSNDLFNEIQVKKNMLANDQDMNKFFVSHGVAENIVQSGLTNSPSITLQIHNDEVQMKHYNVMSIPSFVINARYKTGLEMAQNEERLFAILDFLVQKENDKAKGSPK